MRRSVQFGAVGAAQRRISVGGGAQEALWWLQMWTKGTLFRTLSCQRLIGLPDLFIFGKRVGEACDV